VSLGKTSLYKVPTHPEGWDFGNVNSQGGGIIIHTLKMYLANGFLFCRISGSISWGSPTYFVSTAMNNKITKNSRLAIDNYWTERGYFGHVVSPH
jgi:hypothetical protein